jgi:hypothetical protein
MSKATLALPFALAMVVAVLGCSPPVPSAPTYTKDVGPLLAAHCARCHSADFTPVLDPIAGMTKTPRLCHLDSFDDTGDCSATGMAAGMCRFGAKTCAGMFHTYITADVDTIRMPKPPSDKLNDWEIDVLDKWAANPLQ